MKGVVGPVNGQDAEVATVAGSCTPPKAAKAEAVRGGCDFICETNPIFPPSTKRHYLEVGRVEFIDENGGGPGVRLRKSPKQKG